MSRDGVKTVIIGLDGVPFHLLEDLAGRGIMPQTGEVISQGIFRKMRSSIPEVSSTAWSSIITGRNPAEHGIFGFTDLYPASYRLRFPNFSDLKASPFWSGVRRRAVVINVPSTYPVREMFGAHISGFVSLDMDKSVHPKELVSKLKELDYRLDVDSQKAHKSLELFLADLDKTLTARIEAYRYLWQHIYWETFMLVFTGTDRLMHFLWDAYQDEGHRYHEAFLDHFRRIDDVIGEIGSRLSEKDSLLLLSDHGMERSEKDVYINYFLKEKGFLGFRDEKKVLRNIDSSTKAFALEPARVYINLRGKYPRGAVARINRSRVVRALELLFDSLRFEGRKVIKGIYRKEEIYSGPFMDQAPDLVLLPEKGFNLRATIAAERLFDGPAFAGKHTQDDAFLLVKGPVAADAVPEDPCVYDVRGIIDNLTFIRREEYA